MSFIMFVCMTVHYSIGRNENKKSQSQMFLNKSSTSWCQKSNQIWAELNKMLLFILIHALRALYPFDTHVETAMFIVLMYSSTFFSLRRNRESQ